jgi:orotate phosphoribosyltransferase
LPSERQKEPDSGVLYSVAYRIPDAFHRPLRGQRVAIVDDAINAGSASRATFAALKALGARPVVVGALLLLGETASRFLADSDLPLECIALAANELWTPADCPFCASRVPLSNPPASQ